MIIIKYSAIFLILIISSIIGVLYSKKYFYRVQDLEEMKNALNMFEAKIKYTYEPIPDTFIEISKSVKSNIGKIFFSASNYMNNESATISWEKAVKESSKYTNFNSKDIVTLCNLSKMLGNTDINGQVSNIKLTSNFLDCQIEEAQIERRKNEKLYKTLGAGIGLTIAIILV